MGSRLWQARPLPALSRLLFLHVACPAQTLILGRCRLPVSASGPHASPTSPCSLCSDTM